MSEETLFEVETDADAAAVATLLRGLADGFEAGTALTFGDGEATVAAPPRVSLAVELERERSNGGPADLELELEFEWAEAAAEPSAGDEPTGRGEAAPDDDAAHDDETAPDDETTAETDEAPAAVDHPTSVPADEGGGADDEAPASSDEPGVVAPSGVASMARFQLYRDRADEWRWRLVHRNGNVIADSGEGYSSRQNARKGLRSVMRNAPGAETDVEE